MAESKYQFDWDSRDLRRLLRLRDRFTQASVRTEFESDPEQGKVVLDAGKRLYATPVKDNRYTVVWQLMDDNLAKITAVVASQFRDESPEEFKSKLEEVVNLESHGMVKLS
jgi:2-polyprenyl-6-methoxyphenol hydroxylase-like FAD-dependent oxidoreductase